MHKIGSDQAFTCSEPHLSQQTHLTSGRSRGKLCVKIEGVVSSGTGGLERGRDLSVPQLGPVDGLEEGMCLDVLYPVGPVPQPVLRVALEEHSEK